MATVWADSFDSYGTATDLTQYWGSKGPATVTYSSTAGKFGGGAVVINNSTSSANTGLLTTTGFTSTTTNIGGGFWFTTDTNTTPTTAWPIMQFYTSGGASLIGIGTNTSGKLCAANAAGTLIATGTTTITDGAWHWVEFILTIGNAYAAKIWIDSVQEINFSTLGGTAGTAGLLKIWPILKSTGTTTYDDIIIIDDSGSSGLTTTNIPLGPRRAGVMRPSSDNSVTWTPSTGTTHWNLINETAGSNTGYVSTTTTAQQELYGYTSLGFSPGSISTVVVKSYIENSGGSINCTNTCKSGTTTSQSASFTVPATAAVKMSEFYKDPNTSAAWANASAVNSALFGIST